MHLKNIEFKSNHLNTLNDLHNPNLINQTFINHVKILLKSFITIYIVEECTSHNVSNK